jgi:nicotinate-nucleotide adenylyltransferase
VAIGVFGGTFDPIHIGHLRTGLELCEHLGLDEMRFMPCGDPPHREPPGTPAGHRLAMARLAIEGESLLRVDDREVRREGLSYSIDSVAHLREEIGARVPLCLCVGLDSLVNLNTWHRWRELADYAHILVAVRPGWSRPETGEVADWLAGRRVDDARQLLQSPAGGVHITEMTLLPVSATEIRDALAAGRSIRYLTPNSVIDYIRDHNLYRS